MKQLNETLTEEKQNLEGGALAVDPGVAKIRELETRVAQLQDEKEANS